jgi:hypothetical protein
VKILAAVAIIVIGAWLWTGHTNAQNEHRLGAVASELAGRPVGVDCQGFWAAMLDIQSRSGEVDFPQGRAPDHMFLTHGLCGRLRRFMGSHSHRNLDCLSTVDWSRFSFVADYNAPCLRGARDDAEAVNTLAHESMHLRGFMNEAQTQCYAIQQDAWAVVRLGGTEAQGDGVANLVLALQPGVGDDYQSSDCRAGGALDLDPGTPAFPSETPPAVPPVSLRGPAA